MESCNLLHQWKERGKSCQGTEEHKIKLVTQILNVKCLLESINKPINTHQPGPTCACVKSYQLKSKTSFQEVWWARWSSVVFRDAFSHVVQREIGLSMCSWLPCEQLSRIFIGHRNDRIIKSVFVLTLAPNQMECYENFYGRNGSGKLKITSLAPSNSSSFSS